MKHELRLSDSNASSDSEGKTWGLEGNLFWFLIGGLGAGVTLFFLMVTLASIGFVTSLVVALVPVALALIYIYGLRQGKPPGYDRDWFELWIKGSGFSPSVPAEGSSSSPWASLGSDPFASVAFEAKPHHSSNFSEASL